MFQSRKKIQEQFTQQLEGFLSDQKEETLAAVYELGRNAVKEGIGELEVIRLYHETLDNISKRQNGKDQSKQPKLALNFLTEFLAPYEMRQRGFKDLIEQLNKQNDQLRKEVEQRKKTEEKLKKSKEYFQRLIENALDIITVLNYDGTIRYGSPSIEKVLDYSPDALEGKDIFAYVHPDDREKVRNALAEVLDSAEHAITIDFRIKHNDGSWRNIESIAKNVVEVKDPGIIVNSRDLTERITAYQELQLSQDKLAAAQQIAHLGSWEWDLESDTIHWSDEMCKIYGLTPGNCPQSLEKYLELQYPEDRDKAQKVVQKALENKTNYEFEHRIVRPDGEVRTLYGRGELIINDRGDPVKLVGTGQDITKMKEAEKQLREYSEKLKNYMVKEEKTREDERIRIAREIHDELGQMLTVLKLDISMVIDDAKTEFNVDSESEFICEIQSITGKIDTIIKSIQRISKELRPDIFDHLGLEEALQWQAKEFEKRTGIKYTIRNEANCMDQMFDDQSIAIYRIFQETLTNILRHADATHVDILLKEDEHNFILEINDNGRGINEKNIRQSNSLGIIGMKERSQFLNGNIVFVGEKGKGTTVRLKIPLDETNRLHATSQS